MILNICDLSPKLASGRAVMGRDRGRNDERVREEWKRVNDEEESEEEKVGRGTSH